jgi:hypothetical protein
MMTTRATVMMTQDDDDNKSNKSDSDRRVRGLTEESTGTDRRVYGE